MRRIRAPRWMAVLMMTSLLGACRAPLPAQSDQAVAPMDPDRVLIGRIQGSADTSPLLGRKVAIEGIVTRSLAGDSDEMGQELAETLGDGNRGKVVGWFVQDEGDGVDATSDAVFVLDQGYDTGIGVPGESEYTLRMGTRVRTGDRIKVRGVVAEVAQDIAADQPRSSGHQVGRGDPAGSITTIEAGWITLLSRREHRPAIALVDTDPERSAEESAEAMRLGAPGSATASARP
ncbi:hypothetical protein [Xanthomonas hortorum]|uniref:DUF5666 domain-containing protein n=2 Tax=Xanthomonas hortorum pv. pelargonii TaxID=453602 RepID=A0A6V7F129_9XANT|nr:hypothetical protein [Xanthomonas hortorum]MCE4352939.1 hypothetical protein [Xanthomonas hortorum pv. pelargonii]MCM5525383.1 hypothetical protein [Xanthomonas hortorum pv. pelargonii]MCM5537883.1 hypothetical protein [Xanthomonas hortorum pv. pelargonii]MCM5542023.1 hypothetical protein [Xanthomonas hortorum pv. pelargonii]MCM5545517.1 hypothetical protein [Xanthomonas hortorum pv. pelargonii]